MRYPVTGIAVLAEFPKCLVGSPVNDETSDKDYQSDNKTGVAEPFIRVATGEGKNETTIKIAVDNVEQKAKAGNNDRHAPTITAQAERIYKSTVYVVRFPEQ